MNGINGLIRRTCPWASCRATSTAAAASPRRDSIVAKRRSTQLISSGDNFLLDINLDGTIDTKDVNLIKSRSGRMIP